MSKPRNIEPIVREVLIFNELARGDNFILYAEVLRHFASIDRLTFEEVCLHHVQLGIPSLETITRCRRKIQEKEPDLRDPEAEKARLEKEAEMYAYAKEV